MEENQVNLPDIIRKRKLLPFEVKRKIINSVFLNCIVFISMMIVTMVINVAFNNLKVSNFDAFIDIVQVLCAIATVGIFEFGYRKDMMAIWIHALEFLIFSVGVLYTQYMYVSKGNYMFLKYVIIGFAIFYVLKSLITFVYLKNKYVNDNLSDIRELVKEEKKGYLDEPSTKTLKLQRAEEELRKKARAEKLKKRAKQEDREEN